MVKNFTRTITTSDICFSKIDLVSLKPSPMPAISIDGELTEDEAMKLVIKKFGKPSTKEAYVITEIKKNDRTYTMSLETFLKYASIVEPKIKDTNSTTSDSKEVNTNE